MAYINTKYVLYHIRLILSRDMTSWTSHKLIAFSGSYVLINLRYFLNHLSFMFMFPLHNQPYNWVLIVILAWTKERAKIWNSESNHGMMPGTILPAQEQSTDLTSIGKHPFPFRTNSYFFKSPLTFEFILPYFTTETRYFCGFFNLLLSNFHQH